ncbi:MAG: hypothetical protein IJV77_07445 [Clostridia bacterium]|nr:hypothetical protein [Clostridia bacterium]
MAKFFGVTPQQREQMKNKDNPDFKKKSKSQTSWILLVVLAILAVTSVFLPIEIGNFSALGFGKVSKYFWIPLVFAAVSVAYTVFAFSLKKHGIHYLTQFIAGCLATVVLIIFGCSFSILGLPYQDGYHHITYAESLSGTDFGTDNKDTYTLDIDGIYVTYYYRPNDVWNHPYEIPFDRKPTVFLNKMSFDTMDIPASTDYYDLAIFNLTTNEWMYQNNILSPGTYECFVVFEDYNNTAGILITNVTLTI